MHRSLRDNGLFRSSSNYRVDNEGFDSKKPRLLFLLSSLSSLFFRADGAASPFRVPSSDGLEARWRKGERKKRKEKKKDEMKRRRRERGARWQRERLARTKQARKKGTRRVLAPKTEETNEDERASEDTTWWKGPREGSSSSPLLFSAPSRENSPSFSSCPAVSSPWNVHRRTSRCNLPYETCTYTCIHRARILPLSPLSTFLPRNARTRVCLSASRAESSPPFVRIRKSSTVERLSSSSWMEIGIPLPLCTSQDSIVGNSKWRNRVTKRNRIWVIWTKDYITRLLSL